MDCSSRIIRRVARAILLASGLLGAAAQANIFTVNTTADVGAGSLRQAILDANAIQVTGGTVCARHSIVFAIPGTGLHTITPLTPLPRFDIPITLDGYTQPGSSINSVDQGENAVITIELNGSATTGNGIEVGPHVNSGVCGGGTSEIRGLVINRFSGAGIQANNGGLRIVGNFIGTDPSGMLARGNGSGIVMQQNVSNANQGYNIVGDEIYINGGGNYPTAQNRNVISGNALDGIYSGSTDPVNFPTVNDRIRGNYIGLNAAATGTLANGRHGVWGDLGTLSLHVEENLIAGNGGDGVRIANDTGYQGTVIGNGIGIGIDSSQHNLAFGNLGNGVRIGGNSVGITLGRRFPYAAFAMPSISYNGGAGLLLEDLALVDASLGSIGGNTGLAIDIAPLGVNPNDNQDIDTGPNEGQNSPLIAAATFPGVNANGVISGTLNSTPNTAIEVHFFRSPTCDSTSHGGGTDMLPAFANVTTDAAGNASFSVATSYLAAGTVLTAQSRRYAATSIVSALIVSEFSVCLIVGDLIFADGFGP